MAAIRGKDTKPERIVRSILRQLGYRFRLYVPTLPGKPDIVLPRLGVAVLVHGCFWHSHACKRGRSRPESNTEFWRKKLAANKARDIHNLAALRRAGWRVFVVWECRTADPAGLAKRLSSCLVKPRKQGNR